MRHANRAITSFIVILVLVAGMFAVPNVAAQTPGYGCGGEFPQLDRADIASLYEGRAATGEEAWPIVQLLDQYGTAIQTADRIGVVSVVTPKFDEAMGYSACSDMFSEDPSDDPPVFQLTPMRVTTDDSGIWLAFIERTTDDGLESGYRDVFMVVAIEQDDGSLLIDFAHKDIEFTVGSFRTAEEIYLNGL